MSLDAINGMPATDLIGWMAYFKLEAEDMERRSKGAKPSARSDDDD